VSADRALVSQPFLVENAPDLHCVINPALASPERGVEERLAKFLAALLATQPLSSKASPLNYDKEVRALTPRAKPLTPDAPRSRARLRSRPSRCWPSRARPSTPRWRAR
jgi:hypothetical protein